MKRTLFQMQAIRLSPSSSVYFPTTLLDVLRHGYWHARSREFLDAPLVRTIEWLRMPGDLVFIACGVVPLLIATVRTYVRTWTDNGRHLTDDAS